MNSGVVKFDYNYLQSAFPELSMTPTSASIAFEWAEQIVNNTTNSYVCCCCKRKNLLNLLTAHIIALNNRGAGNVGTIGNASEGSVSVGYNQSSIDKLGAGWFGQTQYGLLFWQMAKQFMSGFYVP